MSKIPYSTNRNAVDTIKMLVNPNEMIDRFEALGILNPDATTYASKVCDMCNYATAYIGMALSNICDPSDITVKEGVFGMIGNHTWVEIEGCIIDATLQQFLLGADRLSIIDNSWSEYHAVKTYTFNDWLENSPNLM